MVWYLDLIVVDKGGNRKASLQTFVPIEEGRESAQEDLLDIKEFLEENFGKYVEEEEEDTEEEEED